MTNKTNPGKCVNCHQGYTKEGYAAFPDHIEMCPLHAAAPDLLEVAQEALIELRSYREERHGSVDGPVERRISAAIAKAIGQEGK